MLKDSFFTGPFEIRPAGRDQFDVYYGVRMMRRGAYAPGATRQAVVEQLGDVLAELRRDLEERTDLFCVELVTAEGEVADHFYSEDLALPGMGGNIPNDQSALWAKAGLMAMPVTLHDWPALVARHRALVNGWIGNLLPEAVMTTDVEEWRAPTAWEIRHVVGEGSLTGVSGAKAAELVGVTPANFRKYTAGDTAKNRQSMSFAAWHLLLLRLRITRGLDYAA